MTLDQFRSVADRALEPFVALSTRVGVSPDAISVLAFLAAVAAGGVYYVAGEMAILYLAGAVLVGLNGALDLLDGAVAREQNVDSKAGDLLDHVLDRYADIVIIAGLAAGIGSYVLGFAAVTGVLMTSYLGTQAQAVGLDRVYAGVLGRADRLAIIGIVTGIAAFVQPTIAGVGPIGWLLVLFAVVGHVTALQRFWGAWNALD